MGGMGCGGVGLDEGIVNEEVWKGNLVEHLVGISERCEFGMGEELDEPACREGV